MHAITTPLPLQPPPQPPSLRKTVMQPLELLLPLPPLPAAACNFVCLMLADKMFGPENKLSSTAVLDAIA